MCFPNGTPFLPKDVREQLRLKSENVVKFRGNIAYFLPFLPNSCHIQGVFHS